MSVNMKFLFILVIELHCKMDYLPEQSNGTQGQNRTHEGLSRQEKRFHKSTKKYKFVELQLDERKRLLMRKLVKLNYERRNIASKALFIACETDDLVKAEYYLNQGADVTCRNNEHRETLLHICAMNESVHCAELILKRIISQNDFEEKYSDGHFVNLCHQKDKYGFLPIHVAVIANSLDMVKIFVKHGVDSLCVPFPDVDGITPGSTPLHYAVEQGYGWIVQELCVKETQYFLTNQFGQLPLEINDGSLDADSYTVLAYQHLHTLLRLLCEPSKCPSFIRLSDKYIERSIMLGFNIDQFYFRLSSDCKWHYLNKGTTGQEYTLLMWAVKEKRLSTVRLLVYLGCDTNIGNRYVLPIHLALEYTNSIHEDILLVLLRSSLDLNKPTVRHRSPLHYLLKQADSSKSILRHRCVFRGVELLLEYGEKVNCDHVRYCIHADNVVGFMYMLSAGASFPQLNRWDSARLYRIIGSRKSIIDSIYMCGRSAIQWLHTSAPGIISQVASLECLASNIIRKELQPNAWYGVGRLQLPPGYNKQGLLINIQNVIDSFHPIRKHIRPLPPLPIFHPLDVFASDSHDQLDESDVVSISSLPIPSLSFQSFGLASECTSDVYALYIQDVEIDYADARSSQEIECVESHMEISCSRGSIPKPFIWVEKLETTFLKWNDT